MPRKTRFIVAFSIALAAVAALFLQPSQGVDATGFRPGVTYRTCDDASGQAFPNFACNLNVNPATILDSVTGFDIAPPDANFSAVIAYTSSSYYSTANDAAIPNGAIVGELHSLATLGLVNGGCSLVPNQGAWPTSNPLPGWSMPFSYGTAARWRNVWQNGSERCPASSPSDTPTSCHLDRGSHLHPPFGSSVTPMISNSRKIGRCAV